MTGGSRCGLPAGTASLVRGLLEQFEEEVDHHLEGHCPLPRRLILPTILGYDPESGSFTYDHRYGAKRPDWTYPAGVVSRSGSSSGQSHAPRKVT